MYFQLGDVGMAEYSLVEKFVRTPPPTEIATGDEVKCERSRPNSTVSAVQRNAMAVGPSSMYVCLL